MIVNPYAQRKAELLWIVHPANDSVINLVPARFPSSFAARIVIPKFNADFIVHDERASRPAYDKSHLISDPSVVQHEWHLRTTLGLLPDPQYADARDCAYILDVLHPYLFREITHIIESTVIGEDYAPQPIPEISLRPRRSLGKTGALLASADAAFSH